MAIDRFTGGALDKALFDESPARPVPGARAAVQFELRLDEPTDGEAGVLLLAVRDLLLGDISLGGEGAVGRGVVRGDGATVALCRADGAVAEWALTRKDTVLICEKGDAKVIDGFVQAAQAASTVPNPGSRRPKDRPQA